MNSRNQIFREVSLTLHRYVHVQGEVRNDLAEILEAMLPHWHEGERYAHHGFAFDVEKKDITDDNRGRMTVVVSVKTILLAYNLISTAKGERLELVQGHLEVEEFKTNNDDTYADSEPAASQEESTTNFNMNFLLLDNMTEQRKRALQHDIKALYDARTSAGEPQTMSLRYTKFQLVENNNFVFEMRHTDSQVKNRLIAIIVGHYSTETVDNMEWAYFSISAVLANRGRGGAVMRGLLYGDVGSLKALYKSVQDRVIFRLESVPGQEEFYRKHGFARRVEVTPSEEGLVPMELLKS